MKTSDKRCSKGGYRIFRNKTTGIFEYSSTHPGPEFDLHSDTRYGADSAFAIVQQLNSTQKRKSKKKKKQPRNKSTRQQVKDLMKKMGYE